MAKLSRKEEKLLNLLLKKVESKPVKTEHTAEKSLKSLVKFMSELGYTIKGEAKENTYKLKNGSVKKGYVVNFSNNKTYQVGQYRSWKLKQ